MKPLPTSTSLTFALAVATLCTGIFQACQTQKPAALAYRCNPIPRRICWEKEHKVFPNLELTEDQKRSKVNHALSDWGAETSGALYCRNDQGGKKCEPLGNSAFTSKDGASTDGVVTAEIIQAYQSKDPEAIHVAQRVDFQDEGRKKKFLQEIGLAATDG